MGKIPFSELVVALFCGPFMRERSYLPVLMIKVHCQALLVLKLKTYFLGWKCVLTVLSWAPGPFAWPSAASLRLSKQPTLDWQSSPSFPFNDVSKGGSTCQGVGPFSPLISSGFFSNWGLSCQHSAYHCCDNNTLLTSCPLADKRADQLESSISNSS